MAVGADGGRHVLLPAKSWLAAAFRVSTGFMPEGPVGDDFYTQSPQCFRRFTGVRLFMILTTLGHESVAAQIEHQAGMGDLLRQKLERSGRSIVNHTRLPVVCFIDANGIDPKAIVEQVLLDGGAGVSCITSRGSPCIRVSPVRII